MARAQKYDVLFEPIRIGPKTLRNRFYKTPHCTNFGSDWPGAQAYFRAMAAEGGWAAASTEYCSIHPASDHSPLNSGRLWDDHDVRNLSLMCDLLHEHGALAGVEFWTAGAHTANFEPRLPAPGVSQIVSDCEWRQSCYQMDRDDIRAMQRIHVEAARRARSAGFDIINLYGGHDVPLTYQFLDPYYNKRTDEYGGSFGNRARFWLEVLELVKAEVGDQCAIAVRISMDSLRENGTRLENDDVCRFIELADNLVDLWDLQIGGSILEWGQDTLSSRFAQENFQKPWHEMVRPHTKKPIVGVGRFNNPDTMAEVIRSGQLDIIGSARASIADPFLPRKIEEGRLDDIRECIGNNICAGRVMQGALIVCTQNATAGEEYRRGWHPERFSRAKNADSNVLIIGAGPAGMECAVTLGKRGLQRVHLVDAADEMGGSLRWIPELPGLGEWSRVVGYRQIQISKLPSVEFIPATTMDAKSTREYGADIVIVATGSGWTADGMNGVAHETIPGADGSLPHVLTPEQVMVEGKQPAGDRVLVYDTDGYYMGVSLAEKFRREGRDVTLVTPHSQIAPYMFFTLEGWQMNRLLHKLGVRLISEHMITKIEAGRASGCHIFATGRPVEWAADAVVLVTQRISNDGLYKALKAGPESLHANGITGLYRIGDCVVPRLIAEAIFDGHRLAREIDTANPAIALPFIRENRVLGASDDDYDAVLHQNGRAGTPSSRLRRIDLATSGPA
jgi:dimethylamine/trimethylamine dehydrogenase